MRATLFVLALLVSVSLLGCTKTPADPGDETPTQATVKGAIGVLEECYNAADFEVYRNLLNENDFTFYFEGYDPDDPLSATYNYVEDIDSTRNLFDHHDAGVLDIDLTLTIPEFDEPAVGTDTFTVEEVPYDLYVTVPADNIIYYASHTCKFEFTRVDGKWLITKWWDVVSGYITGGSDEQSMECTWGSIKAM